MTTTAILAELLIPGILLCAGIVWVVLGIAGVDTSTIIRDLTTGQVAAGAPLFLSLSYLLGSLSNALTHRTLSHALGRLGLRWGDHASRNVFDSLSPSIREQLLKCARTHLGFNQQEVECMQTKGTSLSRSQLLLDLAGRSELLARHYSPELDEIRAREVQHSRLTRSSILGFTLLAVAASLENALGMPARVALSGAMALLALACLISTRRFVARQYYSAFRNAALLPTFERRKQR